MSARRDKDSRATICLFNFRTIGFEYSVSCEHDFLSTFLNAASQASRRDTPELCQNLSPLKTEGAGNAGCPLRPQPRVRYG
jgi:hypothetical protein